jgi:predicted transcriptional regulator of viral defense system
MYHNTDWTILKRFSGNGMPCFSYQDAKAEFPDRNANYLSQVLGRMVDEGMLVKIGAGLYAVVPLERSAEGYLPDWHLTAKYLMQGKPYYVGYYSAMQLHGLITQPSLSEIIVTNTQVKPGRAVIQGIDFQYVYHNTKRFFGYEATWLNDHDKVMCSDLEKTIVDSLVHPQYSGGVVEIAKAIYDTKDKLDRDKLAHYFERIMNKVAIRRYVCLAEMLGIGDSFHETLLTKSRNGSFLLLDPSAPNEGKIDTHWQLKINRDINTIKQANFS